MSHESLQGSQGSMALDLHLDCPVTLRVRDRRRNPLRRQRRVDEDERQAVDDSSRRNSHSCSPRLPSHHHKDFNISHPLTGTCLLLFFLNLTGGNLEVFEGGSAHQLPTHSSHCSSSNRRSSNASDCTHRSRSRRRECPHSRGRLERAISSDSRLTGSRCHHHHSSTHTSIEQEPPGSSSDTDVRNVHANPHLNVHRH